MQVRSILTIAAITAALLLSGAVSAHATPLEGAVLGDAGQAIDGATVWVSAAAPADSFEQDFDGWTFHTDREDLSTVERSTEIAFDGDTSVRFLTSGRFDDGTAWLQKTFVLDPLTTYRVNLSWFQTNLFTSDIGRWPVVAYAGTVAPQVESDFTQVGRDSAAEGFTRYGLSRDVTTDTSGELVLAFGVSVVFEVDRAHFFDQVRPSVVALDDIQQLTTGADGGFTTRVSPGLYRVSAEAQGFLSDVDVPVKAGAEEASLELVKIEDVYADAVDARLVESAGNGEKLFVFASLTTPSGVRLEGAECIGDLELADGSGGLLTAVSDNGTCTFRYQPADGTVTRGPALFTLNDVESEGKTHAPRRSQANPLKLIVE